ncbi:glutathione S-transferase family protein [Sphingomonas sp. DG1-23]|uniref:glutathione S-transferase family protein n=1 Tax=Sphingomonas sp. DG1-23 TaxID=3068316 RepID=UPI00274021A0|nr:glutathione S-transferase family protein [Sphingomonas sp. DG1-23]MDP5277587.1 glutathione S-transferase family protein [Sphingomonas sp. DG1-23]
MGPFVLHEYALSGNCYKIRLVAAHVGLPLERRQYDILKGETRTAQFLAEVNANGRIPVLQIGDDFLPESNAAAFYLADGSDLIPVDRFERADLLRWLFWEQYNHEPNIATVRFWRTLIGEANLTDLQRAQLPGKIAAGEAALALMDEHLGRRDFFVLDRLTLADITLYAYTHVAGEGGFDLQPYPNVRTWLARVASHPAHIPIIG